MTLSDEELTRLLEDRLMSHGVYVTDYTNEEGTLHVRYETPDGGEGVPRNEVGRVLNVLLDAREDGWEATDLKGWVYDIDEDDPRGSWEARKGWMHALEEGYISETDFSTLVLSTVRT